MTTSMTPLQRTLAALGHKEADRVPVFLLLTMHGARELGLSLPEYYADPRNMVEAQFRLAEKYDNDCLFAFLHAAGEAAAFGCEVRFYEDGPPNAGAPVGGSPADLLTMPVPDPAATPHLRQLLEAISQLAERNQGYRPILAVAVAPFSLPIMLLGLERWVTMLYEEPEEARKLVAYLSQFCIRWANAQLAAGAHAIALFDPMASATMTTLDQFLSFDRDTLRSVIGQVKGPCALALAGGRVGATLPHLLDIGAAGVAFGVLDNLKAVKAACRGRLAVLGNLNGIEMVRWSQAQAESEVKKCLAAAAPGGGFILTDQHGEIPYYVKDETLRAVMAAARRWGCYPLDWVRE